MVKFKTSDDVNVINDKGTSVITEKKVWVSPRCKVVKLSETQGSKQIRSDFEGTWGGWTVSVS